MEPRSDSPRVSMNSHTQKNPNTPAAPVPDDHAVSALAVKGRCSAVSARKDASPSPDCAEQKQTPTSCSR